QVEVIDVATPMTTLRYTGNGVGYRTPLSRLALSLFAGRQLSQTLPGLANFYMVGQWAGSPGVSSVAAMGRGVVRAMCRQEGRDLVKEPNYQGEAGPAVMPARWASTSRSS